MENNSHDSKLAAYWERFAIWIVAILLALVGFLAIDQKSKTESLEVKVQALQVDKVSRQELKDMEDRMGKRLDGTKTDIIDRIDWYFAGRKSKE